MEWCNWLVNFLPIIQWWRSETGTCILVFFTTWILNEEQVLWRFLSNFSEITSLICQVEEVESNNSATAQTSLNSGLSTSETTPQKWWKQNSGNQKVWKQVLASKRIMTENNTYIADLHVIHEMCALALTREYTKKTESYRKEFFMSWTKFCKCRSFMSSLFGVLVKRCPIFKNFSTRRTLMPFWIVVTS